jgi:hypothetical protein
MGITNAALNGALGGITPGSALATAKNTAAGVDANGQAANQFEADEKKIAQWQNAEKSAIESAVA